MRILPGLLLGACAALLIACAAGGRKTVASSPAMAEGTGEVSPVRASDPRREIDQRDLEIEAALARLGLPTSEPAPCAAGGCPAPTAEAMSSGTQPPTADATCKPGPSELCQTSCDLSRSICENANRICVIAQELGGDDAYANGKCARGVESCTKSRAKCCGCL